MRVALLSRAAHPLHPPGGLERAVYHLALHLRARGVETLLFTRPATEAGTFPGEVVFVPYASVPAGTHGRVLDRTLNYPGFARRLGRAAADAVREGRVDVVHAHGLAALGYGRLRERDPSLGAPLVMNPHGMEEHKGSGLKRLALTRLRALSREAARLADRVIATDEAMRGEVSRLLAVPGEKVVVVPNGIDFDEIAHATPVDPARVAHEAVPQLEQACPVFLSVGRVEEYKGFDDVAAALLRVQLPPRWAWVVVGEGPSRQGLLASSEKLRGLTGHTPILPLGRVSEPVLHALYERADVFVHAPRYEGSSLVTLEAMAHGLSVVATRAGGIPDKVVDGETGRLVEPGDVEGLALALAELAGDAAARKQMGEKGRERARGLFAWPALAARTVALYQELLAEVRA